MRERTDDSKTFYLGRQKRVSRQDRSPTLYSPQVSLLTLQPVTHAVRITQHVCSVYAGVILRRE